MKLKLLSIAVSASLLVACGQEKTSEDVASEATKGSSISEKVTNQSDNQNKTEDTAADLDSGLTLDNFDRSIRPQDDLYRYVNGVWLKNTEIPEDRSNYGTFTELAEQAQKDLRAIIEASASAKDLAKGTPEQKVGDLYNSVLDTETLNKRGVKPIEPFLNEIDAIDSKEKLADYFAIVSKRGSSAPMAIFINNDAKDPTQYIMYLTQSGLGLPNKEYYFDETESFQTIRAEYLKHIAKMFELVGLKNGEQFAKDVMSLEADIAEIHWNKEDNRNSVKTYNKKSLDSMDVLAGDFNWSGYFASLGVTEQKELIVRQPTYFSAFNDVFKNTALDQWKTYLKWHLISGNAGLMSETLDQENFAFYGKILQGTPEQQPRWKRAVTAVNNLLGEVVGKVYVKKHFKPEAKQRMLEMVENLREAYRQSIIELDWMGEETKKQALDKLSKFRPKIGYPDKWRDYSALTIEPGMLLENYMAAREFNFNTQRDKLGKPIDRDEWFMTPQTVNAYYNPVMNEIVFPAAILQPPFFNMEADDAVNYGGIGAVIGHEMGHGFDDQGSTYDGDGVLRDWWTEEDKKEFKSRTQQLIDQYSSFEPLPEIHLSGEFTLGENIGDLGGLTIAYKAYDLSLGEQQSPAIDGFSGEQRFFMGWAQVWARKYRETELKRRIKVDPHSPSEYRANGVVRNMPEFMAAFEVKPGDELYLPPEERVKIW
ncbi:M13 family metallopeptidase [Pleionea sediminis]|uniref:M13 family metallopeptidase n=1 Tax=Pleionea sediminis TaxID=2569479 RepID=UPI00118641C0|nr:M13-type metalloendopeptidase [Pleionea sediminis]